MSDNTNVRPHALLDGFEIVPSDSTPFITLDNQSRFYINASARRLLNVNPYEPLSIAYRPSTSEIAIVRHGNGFNDALHATSQYNVDKRYYMSARHFAREYAFNDSKAHVFDFVQGGEVGVVFVFRLRVQI